MYTLNQNCCMNKKDILFFNKKLKYTFHKSTPTTQFVQRVQLHRKTAETQSSCSIYYNIRGEQPSQLSSIMPPHSTARFMPPTQNKHT